MTDCKIIYAAILLALLPHVANAADEDFTLPKKRPAEQIVQASTSKTSRLAGEEKQLCANAQYNVAMMYYEGEGTKQDFMQAFQWCQKAAKQGLALPNASLE